ncbi:MAG: VWA domain-containing protein [Mycobacteriales bacterium]
MGARVSARPDRYRFGAWHGGPDPLAAPYDVAQALDEIGDSVLEGNSPREALRNLLRRGAEGRRGLDDLMRQVRKRQREARQRGQLDGTLQEVRELLERAKAQERSALFPDPDDAARLAEAELDALPNDTARAVRQLADYQWRSPEAAATYAEIQDLLRREVLDSQFRGMKDALSNADPAAMARVKDMLADLNAMLDADSRGEHTQEQFEAFMAKHGEFFPDNPADLNELVDSLARRAAAAERLMQSLSPEQRQELADLMAAAMQDMGLASEMDQLGRSLRAKRPDLQWGGRERMSGEQPLGLGDATTALEELADLDDLESTLGQDYPGASLDDIDPEAVERALGRQAVDDLDALRRLERELERQGYVTREGGKLELTPRAVRRIGATALRRIFSQLDARGRGGHDIHDAGAAGELTGSSREWRYGDEQPLDVVRTVRNAVLRQGPTPGGGRGAVRLSVDDFEVVETERQTTAAVCLLVDLSYSMALRGAWGVAKSTALALHSLVTTRYPQDAIQVIGFSDYARVLQPTELAGLSWDMVQGTNLQHALMIAGRHLAKHPNAEPVVLVVTDGEPTAHLLRNGRAEFNWPPVPETIEATMVEVEKLTRRGATINVFMLDEEPRLVRFVEGLAARNGGRVFSPDPERLGDYVVSDYMRARQGRRAG